MSLTDLQEVLGDQLVHSSEVSSEEQLVSEWEIPSFELTGVSFRVKFYYPPDADKLQRVSLNYSLNHEVDAENLFNKPDSALERSADSALFVCNRLDGLLHKKYGAPTKTWGDDLDEGGMLEIRVRRYQWILPTTTVELTFLGNLVLGGNCGLVYEPTPSEDLDRI
jgi:hypothetical protein